MGDSDYLDRAFEEKAHAQAPQLPIEYKRQVAQEYLAGETLHGLAKRHEINRNLVRIWVAKYEAGSFDSDVVAADIVQTRKRASPRWSAWLASSCWRTSF